MAEFQIHPASRAMTVILLFIGTFFFGTLPIIVRRKLMSCNCVGPTCEKYCKARIGKVISSFLIYLGGGVLLATCLIHLLPEAREGFEKYLDSSKDKLNGSVESHEDKEDDGDHEKFPLPEFVVCCGFFAVYLLEESLHLILGGHSHHIPTETKAIRSLSRSNSCVVPCRADSLPAVSLPEKLQNDEGLFAEPVETSGKPRSNSHAFPTGFSVSGLLTVVALSFHSVFEGFAIGLQKTDKGIWILFAAISVHKFVIAFVVGLEVLTTGGREVLVYIYMGVFAAMSPIGMIAAIITEKNLEDLDNSPIIEGTLNAIATGTLLYVTFYEILQREEDNENLAGWQQFLATFLGFGIMCVVQYCSTLA